MGIDLKKAEDQAKKSFIVRLEKEVQETGVTHDIMAQLKLTLDISGSMNDPGMSGRLYDNGTVNLFVSRFYGAARVLDDDGDMEVFPHSNVCEKLKVPVDINNYKNYVEQEIMKKMKSYYFSGTKYAPMIKAVVADLHPTLPQLAICIVDGDCHDPGNTRNELIKSANTPTFFLYIGIGKNVREFKFLSSLYDTPQSTPKGGLLNNLFRKKNTPSNIREQRKVDNFAFYYIQDIMALTDEELYNICADKFISWYYYAKEKGIF